MPRQPTALLPRLLADSVLPCALAALVLVGMFTLHQIRHVDDVAHLQIAAQLEQLAGTLQHDTGASTQQVLDDARRTSRPSPLQRIDLEEADGRELHSGAPADASFERYRRDLPAGGGRLRTLIVHVDPQPRLHDRQLILLYGALSALGVVLLTLLAALTLRHRVLMPLQRLQRRLDALLGRTDEDGTTDAPEAHREFAQLQTDVTTLAALLAAYSAEQTSIQHTTAIDALDQLRQSQAAQRSKAQFLALVGHHFRQPMQALQLITASLHPGIDAEQQTLLTQMRASIATMTRLLDALLEISQLDAGVVSVTPAPFSVAELFLHDRAALVAEAHQHGVDLAWHGHRQQLHGDVELACALLYQLASNAIAHIGPQGRVLIAARYLQDGVRIEVRDNGPGIPVIHQQRIFEEFVQLHGEGDRREGYGLGLAIAARLAQVLGTRIGLRSEPGRGSTFWFELPRMPIADRGGSTDVRGAVTALHQVH